LKVRWVRRAFRIKTTYAAKRMEERAATNEEVAKLARLRRLSATVMQFRFRLLGCVLRQGGGEPAKAVAYDRFGFPRTLRATRKSGDQRLKCSQEVISKAAGVLEAEGILSTVSEGRGHRFSRVAALAQDREEWMEWIKCWLKKFDCAPP